MAAQWETYGTDYGLVGVAAVADRLYVCRSEPKSFAVAAGSMLGYAIPALS
jgi:hypothetical protein